MNTRTIIAIVLIVIGVAVLGYKGITYTTKEPIVDVPGIVKVEAEKEHTIPIGPIIGGVALAGGLALILIRRKQG
jgi:LPXTG-motif cell wall-anchored protein